MIDPARKPSLLLAQALLTTALGMLVLPSWIAPSIALAQATAPAATGIEGTWQGTMHLPNGPQFRAVFKIARGDNGKLKSNFFYNIDQGGDSITADSVTFAGGALTIKIDRLNFTYTGTMSPDGKSINGQADQGTPLPLILERSTPATEWTIPEAPRPIPPMDPKADPTLEVATIKPSKPETPGKGFGVRAGKFMTVNFTLGEMIATAYGVQFKQVIGAPDWIWTEKFDIQGTADIPGMPSRTQLMGEVQKLMADRFQLKFHRDKKELPALVLTVSKGGFKFKPNPPDPNNHPGLFFTGFGALTLSNVTMADFSSFMQSAVLDRPVVDQTGLEGEYNFTLKWTPDEAQAAQMGMKPPAAEPADAPPNLFTALQEQDGLKLEAGKAMVPVLIIDKVEHPSEN